MGGPDGWATQLKCVTWRPSGKSSEELAGIKLLQQTIFKLLI